LTAEA
jgi:DNA repair exonuclease SbcCD ATPase subunit